MYGVIEFNKGIVGNNKGECVNINIVLFKEKLFIGILFKNNKKSKYRNRNRGLYVGSIFEELLEVSFLFGVSCIRN